MGNQELLAPIVRAALVVDAALGIKSSFARPAHQPVDSGPQVAAAGKRSLPGKNLLGKKEYDRPHFQPENDLKGLDRRLFCGKDLSYPENLNC